MPQISEQWLAGFAAHSGGSHEGRQTPSRNVLDIARVFRVDPMPLGVMPGHVPGAVASWLLTARGSWAK